MLIREVLRQLSGSIFWNRSWPHAAHHHHSTQQHFPPMSSETPPNSIKIPQTQVFRLQPST